MLTPVTSFILCFTASQNYRMRFLYAARVLKEPPTRSIFLKICTQTLPRSHGTGPHSATSSVNFSSNHFFVALKFCTRYLNIFGETEQRVLRRTFNRFSIYPQSLLTHNEPAGTIWKEDMSFVTPEDCLYKHLTRDRQSEQCRNPTVVVTSTSKF